MSKKIKIADKAEIPEGKAIIIYYGDDDEDEVALFNLNGEIFALNNLCPHMEGPLGEGSIDNGIVTCPLHGWQFEIKSGGCVNTPGQDAEKINILVENDEIFLIKDEG